MAKAPGEQHPTARALADDLRRFLDDRPIAARRPTLLDRARRWARRNPGLLWGAVGVLALVAAGLGAFAAFAAREQARTQAALDRERERAREAEERFELARQAADDLVLLSEEELAERPFLESSRRRLLESSLSYYERLVEQRSGSPAEQADLIATRDRVRRLLADIAVLRGGSALLPDPARGRGRPAPESRPAGPARGPVGPSRGRVGRGLPGRSQTPPGRTPTAQPRSRPDDRHRSPRHPRRTATAAVPKDHSSDPGDRGVPRPGCDRGPGPDGRPAGRDP